MGVRTDQGRAQREKVLDYLQTQMKERGYLPPLRTVASDLGLSRTSLYWHLDSLRSQKFITYEDAQIARSLRVTRKQRGKLE